MRLLKEYYEVTKPGIIRGNIITVAAGYMLASRGSYDLWLLLALLVGTSMVIASGCVLNNIFDADIDSRMVRTRQRAMVTRVIRRRHAYVYAGSLGVLGVVILALRTNMLTVLCGLIGLVFYAFIYTYAKRKTHWSTLIGTVPGATPPVAGYVAVTGKLDVTSLLLFAVLVCWQMPHFLAIALRRVSDYKAAHIPTFLAVKGVGATKVHIRAYIVAYTLTTLLLVKYASMGWLIATVMLLSGAFWAYTARALPISTSNEQWAKKVFLISLVVLLVFDTAISVAYYL